MMASLRGSDGARCRPSDPSRKSRARSNAGPVQPLSNQCRRDSAAPRRAHENVKRARRGVTQRNPLHLDAGRKRIFHGLGEPHATGSKAEARISSARCHFLPSGQTTRHLHARSVHHKPLLLHDADLVSGRTRFEAMAVEHPTSARACA